MKASASSEAIEHYQRVLDLYSQKYGDRVDRHKVAGMEKNIATALLSRGLMPDSVSYFDQALKNYGYKEFSSPFFIGISFCYNLLYLLKELYFPGKKEKNRPLREIHYTLEFFSCEFPDSTRPTLNGCFSAH